MCGPSAGGLQKEKRREGKGKRGRGKLPVVVANENTPLRSPLRFFAVVLRRLCPAAADPGTAAPAAPARAPAAAAGGGLSAGGALRGAAEEDPTGT